MDDEKVKNKCKKYSSGPNGVVENVTMPSEFEKKSDLFNIVNENSMSETTKITDLNTDSMEAIFEYLEFDDLVNIAETSKQFYTAACQTYNRKYGNVTLIFDLRYSPRYLQ